MTGMCDSKILHWLVKTSKLQTRSSILHDICNLFIWQQVKHKLAEGGIDLIRDTRLQPEFPPDIFTTLTDLALNCTMYERLERPTMKVCSLSGISCSWKSQSLSRTRLKWSLPSQAWMRILLTILLVMSLGSQPTSCLSHSIARTCDRNLGCRLLYNGLPKNLGWLL